MKYLVVIWLSFIVLLLVNTKILAQEGIAGNNEKLFKYVEDTLYINTGNIITVDLSEFPSNLKFSYRCDNADIFLKNRNTITVMPFNNRLVTLYVSINQDNLGHPGKSVFIIGKKNFNVLEVPKPEFYVGNINDTLVTEGTEINIFPGGEYLKKYPYDSECYIERCTIVVKRGNSILFKTEMSQKQKILLSEIINEIKLEKGDIIQIKVDSLYRKNYRGTRFLVENWNNSISLIYKEKISKK